MDLGRTVVQGLSVVALEGIEGTDKILKWTGWNRNNCKDVKNPAKIWWICSSGIETIKSSRIEQRNCWSWKMLFQQMAIKLLKKFLYYGNKSRNFWNFCIYRRSFRRLIFHCQSYTRTNKIWGIKPWCSEEITAELKE